MYFFNKLLIVCFSKLLCCKDGTLQDVRLVQNNLKTPYGGNSKSASGHGRIIDYFIIAVCSIVFYPSDNVIHGFHSKSNLALKSFLNHCRMSITYYHNWEMFLLGQTTGRGFPPANQLSEAKTSASNPARHHREWGRWGAEPKEPPLESEIESPSLTQQNHTRGCLVLLLLLFFMALCIIVDLCGINSIIRLNVSRATHD